MTIDRDGPAVSSVRRLSAIQPAGARGALTEAMPDSWVAQFHRDYAVLACDEDKCIHAYARAALADRRMRWVFPRHSEYYAYPERQFRGDLRPVLYWPGGFPVCARRPCPECFAPVPRPRACRRRGVAYAD